MIVCNTPDMSSLIKNWQRPQTASLLHLRFILSPFPHSPHILHRFACSGTIDSQCWSLPHVSVTICSVESQSSCNDSTMPRTRFPFENTFRKSIYAGSWIAQKRKLSGIADVEVMAIQAQLARCELAERTSDRNGCVGDGNGMSGRVICSCGETASIDDGMDDLLRVVIHCVAEE